MTSKIGEKAKWPGFDFNTVVELCYCCGQEVSKADQDGMFGFAMSAKKGLSGSTENTNGQSFQ